MRLLIARTIDQLAPDASTAAQRAALEKVIKAGLLPTRLPSAETIRSLRTKWNAGARSLESHLDSPRQGRPPIILHREILTMVEEAVRTGRPGSIACIHELVCAKASELGLTQPSYHTVRRWCSAVGHLQRAAGRHGAEAAEMDALPHSTVPAEFTHDVWTPDEFVLPVWMRVYLPSEDRWCSFKPSAVLIQDYRSRAIVGYHIADPIRRKDLTPASRTGIDEDELLGALLGAACPELAEPACRAYSGYLPNIVRWDRAKIHDALSTKLEGLGITVPALPGNRPINRGIVERGIGTLKGWCDTLVGHVDSYRPTDRIAESDGVDAQLAARASGKRVPTRTDITPEDLPGIADIRAAFDVIVNGYNESHRHAALDGLTPGQAYRANLRRRPERRSGRELLSIIKPNTTTVTTKGVVHSNDGYALRFAYTVGGMELQVGRPVTYRADPLVRGLFAELRPGAPADFLPPLAVWAAAQVPKDVARSQRLAAYRAADSARDARLESDLRDLAGELRARGETAAHEARIKAAKQTADKDKDEESASDSNRASERTRGDAYLADSLLDQMSQLLDTDTPSAGGRPLPDALEDSIFE